MTERVIPNLVFFYVEKGECTDPFVWEADIQRSISEFIKVNEITGDPDIHVKIPLNTRNEVIGIGFIRSKNLNLCSALRARKSMETIGVEKNGDVASSSSSLASSSSSGVWADMVDVEETVTKKFDYSMFPSAISIQPAVMINDDINYKFFVIKGTIRDKDKVLNELKKCCYTGKVKPSPTNQRTTTSFIFEDEYDGFIASCFNKFITLGKSVYPTCSPKKK